MQTLVRNFLSLVIGVMLLVTSFVATNVTAQEGAGITIIPTIIEGNDSVDPGAIITETIKVTNVNNESKEFYLYTRDIVGVEEGGTPVFAEAAAEPTGYELSQWVSLSHEVVTLGPGEEREISLTITVPDSATPGSHFGAVFASVQPPRLREIGAGVGYEVASIISFRISGDVVDTARVRSLSTDKLFYSSKKVTFAARIENQGNILIRPRGPLTITNKFGGDSDSVMVNQSLSGIFPGAVRDLSIDWEEEGLGFGRYEAVLALAYDGNDGQKTMDATATFWIFPLKLMLIVVAAFASIFAIGYFVTRMYINRAVMRAAGGRRITPQRYRKQVGISRFTFVALALMFVTVIFLIALLVLFA